MKHLIVKIYIDAFKTKTVSDKFIGQVKSGMDNLSKSYDVTYIEIPAERCDVRVETLPD